MDIHSKAHDLLILLLLRSLSLYILLETSIHDTVQMTRKKKPPLQL